MYCAKSSCSLSPCNNIARARARATRCAVYAVMITTLQLQLQRRKTASAADDGQIPSMDGNLRVAKWQKGGGVQNLRGPAISVAEQRTALLASIQGSGCFHAGSLGYLHFLWTLGGSETICTWNASAADQIRGWRNGERPREPDTRKVLKSPGTLPLALLH